MVAVAGMQHGRISAGQLRELGWSPTVVAHRAAAGWLVREHRGAYRLAGAAPSPLGRSVAALLAVDPTAVVSHRTGLEHHGALQPDPRAPVHLTTARHHVPRPGIAVHQAPLSASEVVRIEGVRVATLTRCLVDAAATEPPHVVSAAVQEAEFLRILDASALHAAATGRTGAALLRALAAKRLPLRGEVREAFERRFALFLRDRGFPEADANRRVVLERPRQIVVLDVVWWGSGLAVELDSRQAHATAEAFEADRERDRRLLVQHRIQVVRVTWRQLAETPDAVEADLKALLARGRP